MSSSTNIVNSATQITHSNMDDTTVMLLPDEVRGLLSKKVRGRFAPSLECPVALVNVLKCVCLLETNGG